MTIPTRKKPTSDMVTGVSQPEYAKAVSAYGNLLASTETRLASTRGSRDRFLNIDPPLSVRDDFARSDYEYFRPNESIPTKPKDIIRACNNAYQRIGIVRNVFDLMSDFTSAGIQFCHENPSIQQFHRDWHKKIEATTVSERFSNYLYRQASIVGRRTTAKLKPSLTKKLMLTKAAADMDVIPEQEIEKREIPWKYTFLDINNVDVLSQDIAAFTGQFQYGIRVSSALRQKISSATGYEADMLSLLPPDIVEGLKAGGSKTLVPLDPNKTFSYFYKKDDWQVWATPMLYAILDDLIALEKLRMADLAALDGAISHIRLWKIGDVEKGIFPTEAAFARLASMLMANPGGGVLDLMWGPDIQLEETTSDISKFLGKDKYEPTLTAIYAGLGIPPTLTGSSTAGGMTNNYISIKTLVERLNYGRSVLTAFWDYELRLLQRAMGFKKPASVQYDRMILTDEAAEKALYVQLIDREIVSHERVQEVFGENHILETARLKNEGTKRSSGKLPQKAGPYHNPEHTKDMEKIALQRGLTTPGQHGMELQPKQPGEKTAMDLQMEAIKQKKVAPPTSKKKGRSGQGRPKNSKDSKKRKRTSKIRTSAEFVSGFNWTCEAQKIIADTVHPILLDHFGKQNMRQLTDDEANRAEKLKFDLLNQFDLYDEIGEQEILARLENKFDLDVVSQQMFEGFKAAFIEKTQKKPTLDEIRRIQAMVYTTTRVDENDEIS